MTDLVERLRGFGYGTTNPEVTKLAADEIESLRARLAEIEKQEPYAFDSESAGLTFENHYSDTKPLYLHPDPASAARIADLEQETAMLKKQLGNVLPIWQERVSHRDSVIDQLRSQLRLAVEALERIYFKQFCLESPPIESEIEIMRRIAKEALEVLTGD